MLYEDRISMTRVAVTFDASTARWVASCDDPAGEDRLIVYAETRERAQRLLDERWRARLDAMDHEIEEER
jgi:hypothetical protein